MKNKRMNRRTVLKGAGATAIGLPLLEEMFLTPALGCHSSDGGVPVRAFNVFFGLGIPAPLQSEGFAGVLEPLEPLRKKLLIMRDVDQVRCDESGINAHFDGASGLLRPNPQTGMPNRADHRLIRSSAEITTSMDCPKAWCRRWWRERFSGEAESVATFTVTILTALSPRGCRSNRGMYSTACLEP